MRMLHLRRAGMAAASVIGLSLALASAGCASEQQDTVASLGKAPAAGAPAGAAKGKMTWAQYDAVMRDYVKCLHEKGIPGARYDGHKPKAQGDLDEISGIPVKNNTLPPAMAECSQEQYKKGIDLRASRPEPYDMHFTTPEYDAQARKWIKCMKDAGYPDIQKQTESRKLGDHIDPKQAATEERCRKEAGLPEEHQNEDGTVG